VVHAAVGPLFPAPKSHASVHSTFPSQHTGAAHHTHVHHKFTRSVPSHHWKQLFSNFMLHDNDVLQDDNPHAQRFLIQNVLIIRP
jgi:hypothetical protein